MRGDDELKYGLNILKKLSEKYSIFFKQNYAT